MALIVSLDGLQLVGSRGVGRDLGDQLAALTANLLATADQCGSLLAMGASEYLTIRVPAGHLLFMRVEGTAGLAVVAARLARAVRLIPCLTLGGPCDILFWEAVPGGPLDLFTTRLDPAAHVNATLDLARSYTPWVYERARTSS